MNLPQDFLEEMQHLLNDEFDEFLASYNEQPLAGLRINKSKLTENNALNILPWKMTNIPWISNGFYYDGEDQPSRHPYYFAGLYYLQEPSAMTPASLLPVTPGDKVLDMCAAPGGKATELGVKLQGQGVLFANDISNSRAKALLKNLELFGIPNIFVTSEEPFKLLNYYKGYFDKILIDAPCSGEGMFRKDPKMIKSFLEHGPEYYAQIQKSLIMTAADLLAPGGMILYSTCTFSPLENEAVIQYLLDNREGFTVKSIDSRFEGFSEGRPDVLEHGDESLKNCIRIWPHKMNGEGHFAALIQKNNCDIEIITSGNKKSKQVKTPKLPDEAVQFLKNVKLPISEGTLILKEGKLYLLPKGTMVHSGIRYLRTGLYLGEIVKDKFFEPSQALAMALKSTDFSSNISIPSDDIRAVKYLKGETIEIDDLYHAQSKGWQLVCVDEWSLGWGKSTGDTLKNKYYSGWRWQ